MRRGADRPGRRDIRRKGFIFSFGDVVLPLVGVVAVGLLFVAGRLFFLNGFGASGPSSRLPSPPVQEPQLPVEPEEPVEPEPVPQESEVPAAPEPELAVQVSTTPVAAVEAPPPQAVPVQPVRPQSAASVPQKTQRQPSWRVQVGAYNTKAGANEIVSKLAKSGYKATVFSGPKFHKVWVQAGSSRQAAEAVASRLKRAGFPGSYVVPPPSR